jgi:hypothetical protein
MADASGVGAGQPVTFPDNGGQFSGAQPQGAQPEGAQPSGAQPASGQLAYATSAPAVRLWKTKPDGVTTFRHSAPLVLWWAWIAFVLWNLYDVAVSHPGIHSLRVVVALLFVTGVMYACTLHSRVDTDDEGLTIYNPVQHHRVPWGGVEGIYLGDSVEFSCHRTPPLKDKIIYSWALYSRRRSRARQQMQSSLFSTVTSRRLSERAPKEAADIARQQAAQLMAAELGKKAQDARTAGAPVGYLRSSWSWLPIAAIVVPAIALVLAFVIN